jgi:hypothetical protein
MLGDVKLPVYMRVGDGEEHEIGSLSLPVTTTTAVKTAFCR